MLSKWKVYLDLNRFFVSEDMGLDPVQELAKAQKDITTYQKIKEIYKKSAEKKSKKRKKKKE